MNPTCDRFLLAAQIKVTDKDTVSPVLGSAGRGEYFRLYHKTQVINCNNTNVFRLIFFLNNLLYYDIMTLLPSLILYIGELLYPLGIFPL